MAAWLYQPVMFQSSREFNCEGFQPDQCQYYRQPWHNWYIADWMFALPTVAFFMSTIGIFIIGYALTQMLALCHRPGLLLWQRAVAATRYMSYRGFRIDFLGWNSAPIGMLLLGAIGSVYFFCMDLATSPYYWPDRDTVWGNSPPLGTRSGWLALGCMPFLFATASKTNWITLVTGVTHEKLQIFHRWIAYAFFILALMHTFPFIVWHIRNHDMVYQFTVSNTFEYWTGIVALVMQAWLTVASWGPIRNLGYELFKVAHFLSAVVFMVVFFWHCGGTLTSWDYFVATAAVYVPCWIYPWLRTIFEYGIGQKAQMFVEDNGFIRITIPANFGWQPGQHCFLRFRSFGIHAFSSHPFTICNLTSASKHESSEINFYVRRRGGLTAKLYSCAMMQPGVQVPVFVDGPYGGIDNQKYFSNDRIIVIAGGSGAGWMLPLIEQFVQHQYKTASQNPTGEIHENDEVLEKRVMRGPYSLRVILATRDVVTSAWFHKTLKKMLSDYKSTSTLTELSIGVHLTGEAEHIVQTPENYVADVETSDSSSSKEAARESHREFDKDYLERKELHGRPDLPLIIREETESSTRTGETLSVFVCGPLAMQNDVRNAVAKENLNILKTPRSGGVYLHLEHFSWA